MQDLNDIKKKITGMSKLAFSMWQMTNRAFMEHDLDLLSRVLKDENMLNNLEKEITSELVALSRATLKKEEKNKVVILADVVGDLEMIGDYCKDILERVQIKIEEKLLFSDEAVGEYENLYHKTEEALDEIVCALDKNSLSFAKEVIKKEKHIDSLVIKCRARHDQRLINGICSPMACNMFLNILDFTAQIFHHTETIARNILKLK